MKKILLCLVTVMMLLGLGGCKPKTYDYILDAKDVIKQIENDESFVVYLGATTCSHCQVYGKLVPEYNKKYDLEIGHIVLDELAEKDRDLHDELLSILPIEYTPTTYFIVNGEVEYSVVGALEEAEIVEYLIEYGFLKEAK